MTIAAMSTSLSQASLKNQVGIAVASLALNASKQQGNFVTEVLNRSTPHPTLGHQIDLKG